MKQFNKFYCSPLCLVLVLFSNIFGFLDETIAMSSDISTLLDSSVVLYLDSNGNYVLAMGESEVTLEMQYGIVLKSALRQLSNEEFVVMKMLTFDNNKGEYRVSEKVKVDGVYYKEDPSSVFRNPKSEASAASDNT